MQFFQQLRDLARGEGAEPPVSAGLDAGKPLPPHRIGDDHIDLIPGNNGKCLLQPYEAMTIYALYVTTKGPELVIQRLQRNKVLRPDIGLKLITVYNDRQIP